MYISSRGGKNGGTGEPSSQPVNCGQFQEYSHAISYVVVKLIKRTIISTFPAAEEVPTSHFYCSCSMNLLRRNTCIKRFFGYR